MLISSFSLSILAASLSAANGALPLQRQLSHALESIQQQTKMTSSLTAQKSMIRTLEAEQEFDPDTAACLMAFMMMDPSDGGNENFYCSNDGEAYAQNMGGILCPATDSGIPMCPDGSDATCCDIDQSCDDGDDDWCCGGGDSEDPLGLPGVGPDSEYCDINTGICDLLDTEAEAKIKCDADGGKIILNDMLVCKEDIPEDDEEAPDTDIIIRNIPYCFPQACPDDTNMMEIMSILVNSFAQALNATDTEVTMLKTECASGTTLSVENDSSESDDIGTSSAAARSMILSFVFAAAVGIGAFFTV